MKGGKIRCISAQGKSNIFAHVADTLNEKILVVADGAAFGSEMENGDPSLILPIPRADSFSSRFIRLFFQNRPICCHILE